MGGELTTKRFFRGAWRLLEIVATLGANVLTDATALARGIALKGLI